MTTFRTRFFMILLETSANCGFVDVGFRSGVSGGREIRWH